MWLKGFALQPRPPSRRRPVTIVTPRTDAGELAGITHPVRPSTLADPARAQAPRRRVLPICAISRWQAGALQLALPRRVTIERHGRPPRARGILVLRRWRALWRLMLEGDLGLRRAYIDGDWSQPGHRALLDFGSRTKRRCAQGESAARLSRLVDRLRHALSRQHQARKPPQHRRALRSRQRVLSRTGSIRHELFLRLYARDGRRWRRRRTPSSTASPQLLDLAGGIASWRSAAAGGRWPNG